MDGPLCVWCVCWCVLVCFGVCWCVVEWDISETVRAMEGQGKGPITREGRVCGLWMCVCVDVGSIWDHAGVIQRFSQFGVALVGGDIAKGNVVGHSGSKPHSEGPNLFVDVVHECVG